MIVVPQGCAGPSSCCEPEEDYCCGVEPRERHLVALLLLLLLSEWKESDLVVVCEGKWESGRGMRDRHVRRRLGRIGAQGGVGIRMRGAPTWLVE
jgi:hypothetical protein